MGGKAHRVNVLPVLPFMAGVRVRVRVDAMVVEDDPGLPPCVARQPGVTGRVHIAGTHAISHLEQRADCRVITRWNSAGNPTRTLRRHSGTGLSRSRRGLPGFEFLQGDEPLLDDLLFQNRKPFLVIAHAQIVRRRQKFNVMPPCVDVRFLERSHSAVHGIHPGFPPGMKNRLVPLVPDWAHSLYSTQVMHAVHAAPWLPGTYAFATPTMASRVTRPASSSSVIFSVPAGRSGITMYRSSAVLSHTRTSTSAGTARPNSRSTPLGSMTARERYALDLYQTGGRPIRV